MEKLEKIVKFQKFLHDFNLENLIDIELEKLENKIVELNRQQIKFGNRADGTDIRPEYARMTIGLKRESGTLTNNDPFIVNLYDTGSFYAGFYVLITPKEVIIDSSDGKTSELRTKYGEKIFGLNEQNLATILNEIKTNILDYVRTTINNL